MALVLLAIIGFTAEIGLGSVSIPLSEIFKVFSYREIENDAWRIIILDSRLPRAMAAVVTGAFLSVSGLMMQTLFRNPLAGPHILGISAGSSLGVAIVVLGLQGLSISMAAVSNDIILVLAAFAGAIAVLLLLFAISLRVKDVLTVLIFGILFSAVSLAIVGILQFFSEESQLKAFLIWTLGSFDGVDRGEAWLMLMAGIPIILLSIGLIKPLNLLLIGEDQAQSLGLNLNRSRLKIMLAAGGLTAITTAFCGPIGFVGVIVPHFSRMIFKDFNHKTLYSGTILLGINMMLLADLIAHLPGSSSMLPINSITSLIGVPFICWMLIRKKIVTAV